jgi:hypothetical protein
MNVGEVRGHLAIEKGADVAIQVADCNRVCGSTKWSDEEKPEEQAQDRP